MMHPFILHFEQKNTEQQHPCNIGNWPYSLTLQSIEVQGTQITLAEYGEYLSAHLNKWLKVSWLHPNKKEKENEYVIAYSVCSIFCLF